MITEEELEGMSKQDLYKKYCEVCTERDKIIDEERQKLENELNKARTGLTILRMRDAIMCSHYGLDPMAPYKGKR